MKISRDSEHLHIHHTGVIKLYLIHVYFFFFCFSSFHNSHLRKRKQM